MEYHKSPLQITVSLAENNGPVRVIQTSAYIYRRSAPFAPNKFLKRNYYAPQGEYFVRYAGLTFDCSFTGSGFRMRINFSQFLQLLQIYEGRTTHGKANQPNGPQPQAVG